MGSRARNATASALAAADGAARAAARGGMGAAADFYTPAAARAAAPDAARGAAGLFAPRLAPSADARAAGAGAEGGVSNEVEPGPTNEVEPGPAERSGEESKKKGLSYLALFRYADRIDLILAAAGSVAGAANGVALPAFALIFGDLMDSLNDLTDVRAAVDDNIKWLGVLAGGTLVAGFAQVSCWTLTGERLMGHVRERYLHAALRQDATYYETVRSAEQTFALLGPEVASMTDAVGQNVGLSIQYCVTFVAGLIIAFIRGWRVALVVLAFVPLFVGVLATLGLLLMNAAKKSSEAYSSAATIASGATNAIREVLSATANTFLSATYQDALQPARVSDRTEGIARGSIWGGFFFLMFATYGAVLWIGGIWVADGTMTGGEVITAFFSAMIGGIILGQLAPIGTSMIAGLPAAARLYALIDRVPDVDIEAPGQELKAVEGSITMRGVHFAYPSRPQTEVLRNFDLEIAAGQTVALVGESGSGKSTVIQLVERFYDPSSGSISLDGVDLRRLQVKWLRSQMGLVSQEPVLFSGSIRDNICYGRPDASDADVEAAARAANAHSFINELGQGYDTFCGEGGRALSGGQKQRVAIARALLRKPAVLLLDEATSALDAESEALVQQALEALMAQHTTLLIAHRLSTVRNADRIVVMARGEAVESGTHDQLVAADGAYAQLVQLQMAGSTTSLGEA